MIYNAKIKTIFPLLNISGCKDNGLDRLIEDLQEHSGKIMLPIKHFGDVYLSFSFSDNIEINDFDKNKNYELFLTIDSAIELDCVKIAEEAQMKNCGEGEIPNELYEFIKEKIPDFSPKWEDFPAAFTVPSSYELFYKSYLKYFLIMTQIAYPGTLWLDDARLYMNNSKYRSLEGFTSILFEYEFKKTNGHNSTI